MFLAPEGPVAMTPGGLWVTTGPRCPVSDPVLSLVESRFSNNGLKDGAVEGIEGYSVKNLMINNL